MFCAPSLLQFEEDTVLFPPETAHFGSFAPNTFEKPVPVQNVRTVPIPPCNLHLGRHVLTMLHTKAACVHTRIVAVHPSSATHQTSPYGQCPCFCCYNLLLQTELYSQDWIGLKALDKAGKVAFLSVPGNHLHLPLATINTTIVPFLGSGAGLHLNSGVLSE